MFSQQDIVMLNTCISTQLAVLKRRANAEQNAAIKEILGKQIQDLTELGLRVNNPKLVKS